MSTTDTDTEMAETPTDPGTPVEAPESPVEPSEDTTPTEDTPDAEERDDDEHGGNREAAKYRRKLRDTEAERDALATRLETMQRTEAERIAGEVLAKGAALWIDGTTLADLLDEDGDLDATAVRNRAEQIRKEYGIPAPRHGLSIPREGYNPPQPSSTGSMVDVVMGRNA